MSTKHRPQDLRWLGEYSLGFLSHVVPCFEVMALSGILFPHVSNILQVMCKRNNNKNNYHHQHHIIYYCTFLNKQINPSDCRQVNKKVLFGALWWTRQVGNITACSLPPSSGVTNQNQNRVDYPSKKFPSSSW